MLDEVGAAEFGADDDEDDDDWAAVLPPFGTEDAGDDDGLLSRSRLRHFGLVDDCAVQK